MQHPLLKAIAAAQAVHALFPTPSKRPGAARIRPTIAAVSGGADSVALLHALSQLAAKWHLDLHVAHLNHSLRAESADDAAFVQALAGEMGLPFHSAKVRPGIMRTHSGGVENAARQVRYAFLHAVAQRVAQERGASNIAVVLAHHADDQAETLVMNFLRGTGLHGLGGMRWCTELTADWWRDIALADVLVAEHHASYPANAEGTVPVRLIRPVLGVGKATILNYLRTHKISWHEDSTNRDQTLLRNRVRQQIMPLLTEINPNLTETLGRTAQLLGAEAERVAALDGEAFARLTAAAEPSNVRVVLDCNELQKLDEATLRGVLHRALMHLLRDGRNATFERVEMLRQALREYVSSAGSQPLAESIVWSTVTSDEGRPLLCLHRKDVLPVEQHHPWLDEAWREHFCHVPLPKLGTWDLPNGWALTVQRLSVDALSDDWRSHTRWTAFVDAARVGTLALTTPRPGMSIAPLGMGGHRQALSDVFTNEKVHRSLRAGWPVVVEASTGAVVWLCGLRLSEHVRIAADTREVVRLQWQRKDAKENGSEG